MWNDRVRAQYPKSEQIGRNSLAVYQSALAYFDPIVLLYNSSSMKRNSKVHLLTVTSLSRSPSPVIVRSKKSFNKVSRISNSNSKNIPQAILPIYTLDYCLSKLDAYLTKNIPLSKNCVSQIKNFLLHSPPDSSEQNHNNKVHIRQKTENDIEQIKQSRYLESTHQTDYDIYKTVNDKTLQKRLKRVPFSQLKRQNVIEDPLVRDLRVNYEQKIQDLSEALRKKDQIIQKLEKDLELMKEKCQELEKNFTSALLQCEKNTSDISYELENIKQALSQTILHRDCTTAILQQRQAELLYLWRTIVSPSL